MSNLQTKKRNTVKDVDPIVVSIGKVKGSPFGKPQEFTPRINPVTGNRRSIVVLDMGVLCKAHVGGQLAGDPFVELDYNVTSDVLTKLQRVYDVVILAAPFYKAIVEKLHKVIPFQNWLGVNIVMVHIGEDRTKVLKMLAEHHHKHNPRIQCYFFTNTASSVKFALEYKDHVRGGSVPGGRRSARGFRRLMYPIGVAFNGDNAQLLEAGVEVVIKPGKIPNFLKIT